jgi:addiction module HigA family antidote
MTSENETKAWQEDAAEAAYWEFDARRKGIGQFAKMQMSERDAFKLMAHKVAAHYDKKNPPKNGMRAIHPGEILNEEFLKPGNFGNGHVATALVIPLVELVEFIDGKRDVTFKLAVKLAFCFNTTVEYWLNLQTAYDTQRVEIGGLENMAYGVIRLIQPDKEDNQDA